MSDGVRHVVGVMTGTSIDGIDAALARVTGTGWAMRAELLGHISRPMGSLSAPLRAVAAQSRNSAGELARYGHELGMLHVRVIEELLEGRVPASSSVAGATSSGAAWGEDSGTAVDLICVHGQTVFHDPPLSWQMVNPWPIARRFVCPVVHDLRAADLAAGGQGAPITPMADWILFRNAQTTRAIVNLGGYCNVTVLPAGKDESTLQDVRGFDVCACNQVLDAVAREALGVPYDDDDQVAASGTVHAEAAEELRAALAAQSRDGRSLGTGDETVAWVTKHLRELPAEDLAASAVWAVAGCIGEALESVAADEIYLAGGGAKHRLLVRLLEQRLAAPVRKTDVLGAAIEAREALCMAVLGALCADGAAITLPQVTGCSDPAPLAGVWCGPGGTRSLPQPDSPQRSQR